MMVAAQSAMRGIARIITRVYTDASRKRLRDVRATKSLSGKRNSASSTQIADTSGNHHSIADRSTTR
jgi:hypothetical protein